MKQKQTCARGAGRFPRGQGCCLLVQSVLRNVQLMDQQNDDTKRPDEDKTRSGQRHRSKKIDQQSYVQLLGQGRRKRQTGGQRQTADEQYNNHINHNHHNYYY